MPKYLDLRGTPCPVNFVRCCLAIEKLNNDQILQVDLDKGEPEDMVFSGLREAGFKVEITLKKPDWVRLTITSDAS